MENIRLGNSNIQNLFTNGKNTKVNKSDDGFLNLVDNLIDDEAVEVSENIKTSIPSVSAMDLFEANKSSAIKDALLNNLSTVDFTKNPEVKAILDGTFDYKTLVTKDVPKNLVTDILCASDDETDFEDTLKNFDILADLDKDTVKFLESIKSGEIVKKKNQ